MDDKPTEREVALEEALERLVAMYVANRGTRHEFLSCIGSKHASDLTRKQRAASKYWSAWDTARRLLGENVGG